MTIVKLVKLFGTTLFAGALLLAGCGGKTDDTPKTPETPVSENPEPTITTERDQAGGSIESGDGFGFDDFELEIEIDNQDTIDIEYEVKREAEAKYENELTKTKLKDEDAMDEINKFFLEIRIDKDTPEDVAKEKILQYLGIEKYSSFELEVDFDDGTILKIKDKQ